MDYVLSIITVVYNGEALIEGTIKSVLEQSYPHIEYVLVDGASKDGTMDIVRKFETKIDKVLSEPDKGLYDAMNKGLRLATGDFILFLNAGDHLRDKEVISRCMEKSGPQTDVLYGEVMLVDDNRNPVGTRSALSNQKLPEKLTWKSLRYGMVVSHQAFIPRRKLAPEYIENNLVADIDWVIQCLKSSRETVNTGEVISDYLMGGLSKKRHRESMVDRFKVLSKHYGFFPNLLNHGWIAWRAFRSKLRSGGNPKY